MFPTLNRALPYIVVALALFSMVQSTAGETCQALPQAHRCSAYVDYLIPGDYFGTSGEYYISTTFQRFETIVAPLLCSNCIQNVNASLCRALLPRCESEHAVRRYCDSNLEAELPACGSQIAQKLAAFVRTSASSVPVGNSSLECFNMTNTFNSTTECSYAEVQCVAPAGLGLCMPYVDWPIYKVLPSYDPSRVAGLVELVFPTVNYPDCPVCTTAVRKVLCAGFIMSCTEETARLTASGFIDLLRQGVGTISTESVLNALPRVCSSQCEQVMFNCSQHIESYRNFFFSCNVTTYPGLPPSFQLYPQSSGSCINMTQLSVSPTTCPVFLPRPPGAPLSAPSASSSAPGSMGANVSAPVLAGTPRAPQNTTRSSTSILKLSPLIYVVALFICLAVM